MKSIIGIKKKESDNDDQNETKKKNEWKHYNKKKQKISALENEKSENVQTPPKAVIFVQYTKNSELAGEIKKVIQELRPWTHINLKVVERCGLKLQDLLCKSNPWDNVDCGRLDCFTCDSSAKEEKPQYKNCHQRSVVYETRCETCVKNTDTNPAPIDENKGNVIVEPLLEEKVNGASIVDEKEAGETTGSKRKKEIEKKVGLYFRYIGETSRSVYERGGGTFKRFGV